ncbi:hypothetical protein ACHWQZ_G014637 [Mnemiopsis leidyi]
MTLTAEACGGPNPLVSLANTYRAAARADKVFSQNGQGCGSHDISNLLKQVEYVKPKSTSTVSDSLPDGTQFPLVQSSSRQPLFKQKSLNQSFSEFSVAHQIPLARGPPSQYFWRPHQRYLQERQLSDQRHAQNRNFSAWVQRFHPEILLKVKASEVVDVELSHELAEQWLKDFHLNDVIKVESLSEAEQIVEQWIREFRLGREASNKLTVQDRIDMEKVDLEYEYITEIQDASPDIDMGIDMIKRGDLLSAISIFEGIVQKDAKCGEAWYYLGLCHQQSENEPLAISAFNKVEEEDMCYPSTLLGLAASYLNEYKHASSTDCLEKWLHVSHPAVLTKQEGPVNAATLRTIYSSLQRTPNTDTEIDTALGILACLLDEPHVAAQHFRNAVSQSPLDFMLWNRLGATLANSDRSSESVEAYRRALSLSPGYIRARYNLGIACLNLRAYREGIEHFLTCLKQQDSTAVWQTLRLAISIAGHYQLLEHIDNKSLSHLLAAFNME